MVEKVGVLLLSLAAVAGILWLKVFELPTQKGLLCKHTNLPCPLCGGTRSVSAVLELQILTAFQLNPLVGLAMAFGLLWFAYALCVLLFKLPSIRITNLRLGEVRMLGGLVLLLLILNWVYLLTT